MKKLVFTVTNDLRYDQRMQRCCATLQEQGFSVILVGRKKRSSPALSEASFQQVRLYCFFEKGKLFYLEYNIRLFFYLLFVKTDSFTAIDLDTIFPVFCASKLRRKPRFYDAHELFCEMKEIVERPHIYKIWKALERFMVPRFPYGTTVNQPIADWFQRHYGVKYTVIRNLPYRAAVTEAVTPPAAPFILYQGAVNEGRCFEQIIPAMKSVPLPLVICGDGNFMEQAKALVKEHGLEHHISFTGMLPPEALQQYTRSATIGLNIIDRSGLNNYWSLTNRFFDYIQAGLPQITMNYPAYQSVLEKYTVGIAIDRPDIEEISKSISKLLNDKELYNSIKESCQIAAQELNWENESLGLVNFYLNGNRKRE